MQNFLGRLGGIDIRNAEKKVHLVNTYSILADR